MSINSSSLRDNTRNAFEAISKNDDAQGLTLIGGTALALQIQHRVSEDLDFCTWQDDGKIPVVKINKLTSDLENKGHTVRLITNPAIESTFRINTGNILTDYVRDYLIDGVKVTFFAADKNRHPRRFEFLKTAPVVNNSGCTFSILDVFSLEIMKTVLLEDRAKSRDLFDLMILMRDHGYTVPHFYENIEKYGDLIRDPEHHKAVLRGAIPLDKNDEGLEGLGDIPTMDAIYEWFDNKLTEDEVRIHRINLLHKPV